MTSPNPGVSCLFFLHLVSSAMVRTAQLTDKMIPVHRKLRIDHRHLRNIDCLMACTACLVCFSSSVNGCSKRKEALLTIKTGVSNWHITKLKQSIFIRCLCVDEK